MKKYVSLLAIFALIALSTVNCSKKENVNKEKPPGI